MRRPIAWVALAVLLIAVGCANESDDSDSASTTAAETASTATDVVCEPDDLDAAELEALTVDDVPDGFERQPDDVGDTGPSDLAKAISDDGHEDAEEVITELGFRRGYQWLWEPSEPGEQLVSFVYEFCDEDGARGYAARGAELTETEAAGVARFDVPGLDEHAAATGAGDGYQYAYVDVVEGPFYVRIMTFTEATESRTDALETRSGALVIAQLAEVETLIAAAP